MTNRLIYVHDPMCSWCWAFAPVWAQIRAQLPAGLEVQTLLGGLAPDSDAPMPADMQQFLQQTWRRIEQQVPGTHFNHDFWTACEPRRSTWPACRAVIAAETLEQGAGDRMTAAIQHAYYLEARNPADTAVLLSIAQGLGLDGSAFAALLDSASMRAALEQHMAEGRSMGADSFPTLLWQGAEQLVRLPTDYNDAELTLSALREIA